MVFFQLLVVFAFTPLRANKTKRVIFFLQTCIRETKQNAKKMDNWEHNIIKNGRDLYLFFLPSAFLIFLLIDANWANQKRYYVRIAASIRSERREICLKLRFIARMRVGEVKSEYAPRAQLLAIYSHAELYQRVNFYMYNNSGGSRFEPMNGREPPQECRSILRAPRKIRQIRGIIEGYRSVKYLFGRIKWNWWT